MEVREGVVAATDVDDIVGTVVAARAEVVEGTAVVVGGDVGEGVVRVMDLLRNSVAAAWCACWTGLLAGAA